MAKITFKSKVKTVHWAGGGFAYHRISVPALKRIHCDITAFRQHPKYGVFANSDLFLGVLKGIRETVFKGRDYIRIDEIPDGVTVDTSGFLAEISFDV